MRARVGDAPVTAATFGIPRTRVLRTAGPALALALASVNLRPAMASAGSLLDDVQSGLGLSAGTAGLLTSMPAACFALLGSLTPALVRRAGLQAVVSWAMLALGVGLAARPFVGGEAGFFGLTALALAAIAVGNVAMPVVVRTVFPDRIGTMTGLYSMALTAGAALSAAASVPVAHSLGGWRTGLAIWCIPALLAAALWVVAVRRRTERPAAPTAPPTAAGVRDLARSGTAWALTVFFGLQAAGAYIVLGWLPEIYRDAGLSSGSAGLLLALTPTVGVPFAFLMPALAARLRRQSGLAVALSGIGLMGYAGLWLAPATVPWAWAVLLGVSQASFPLALAMIGLRAGATTSVVTLSAFVQGLGYLISVPCPAIVGILVQRTGGWGAPLLFMAALLVVQAVVGAVAGRGRPA